MKSRAICGCISCLALLKLYVNLQVTSLLNKKPGWFSSVFITVTLTFLDVSELKRTSWHQFGRKDQKKKKKRRWPACDSFKCRECNNWQCFFSWLNPSAALLSCWSVMVCLTVTLMQISILWASPRPPQLSNSSWLSVAGGGGDGYNGLHQL